MCARIFITESQEGLQGFPLCSFVTFVVESFWFRLVRIRVWDCLLRRTKSSRKGNAAANLAVLCHLALNLLEKEKKAKSGHAKRLQAGWNYDYLLAIPSD